MSVFRKWVGNYQFWGCWSLQQFGFGVSYSKLVMCADIDWKWKIEIDFLFLKFIISKRYEELRSKHR